MYYNCTYLYVYSHSVTMTYDVIHIDIIIYLSSGSFWAPRRTDMTLCLRSMMPCSSGRMGRAASSLSLKRIEISADLSIFKLC